MIKTSDFPYPVLRNDKHISTGYKREIKFKIDVEEPENNGSEHIFIVNLDTNSSVIKNLLAESKAELYITYCTSIVRKTEKVNEGFSKIKIKIPCGYLQSYEEIKIYAIVTASQDLEVSYDEEFDEAYDLGLDFFVTKKDVLAISNEIEFEFNKTGKTIIKIQRVEDQVNGFSIDISQEDFILIKVNSNFKKSYDVIYKKQSDIKIPVMTIINSSLIYLAMTSVFMDLIIGGVAKHQSKRWYKVIKNTLNGKNVDLEEKIEELKIETEINEVYKLVDLFLNHFLEKVLDKCSEAI